VRSKGAGTRLAGPFPPGGATLTPVLFVSDGGIVSLDGAGFDLDGGEARYPSVIRNASQSDSIYNIYNSVNISFHPPSLSRLRIPDKPEVEENTKYMNWLDAERVRTEGSL